MGGTVRPRAMIKDDIVALLPDLRAFSRFLCRERESADDLVQNTILAALDKQDQFTPGTNLKGWLFTIMRNRFYSDLRTQRRRPATVETRMPRPTSRQSTIPRPPSPSRNSRPPSSISARRRAKPWC